MLQEKIDKDFVWTPNSRPQTLTPNRDTQVFLAPIGGKDHD
jgi:hypothetical protein